MKPDDKPALALKAHANTPAAGGSLRLQPAGASRDHDAAISPDSLGKRIGILVVAYNAVTTIAKVLQRIPREVWQNVEEIVVFDDASGDHTYELAVGLKTLSGLDKLAVIKNETNRGYGGNQKLGYRYFMDKGFDVVVLLHGDGQYAPEILAHLYAPIVAGEADAVFGSRMMNTYGGALKGGMPLYKYVGNKILTWFETRALGMQLTEFHSGYRAYSLHALRQIQLGRMTDVFHFDTQIIVKLHHQGFRIKEVPIPTYYGNELCYVDGLKYARDVFMSVIRYERTRRGLARHPEFEEYFVHYPIKTSRHSSHDYFEQWVGTDREVLDLGCGEGFFAERLARNRNRVAGADLLAQPQRASAFQDYVQADLTDGLATVVSRLGSRKFDRVLLQDVLEHVPQPRRILDDCRQLLQPRGELLVSLPNVANITVRLALLFGQFEYAERGILDRTHLRFFTRRSARRAVEDAGYEIIEEQMTVMPIEVALGLSSENVLMRAANRLLKVFTSLLPGLFGYQILFRARLPQVPGEH
jgi:2-polyprenyl-3-methyl-5-hydroxy-6-metoxy-1,4-benzoquinol methylase